MLFRKIQSNAFTKTSAIWYPFRRALQPSCKASLTHEHIHEMTRCVIESNVYAIVGKTEQEQKNWCVQELTTMLEVYDNYIPVVGAFLDNPVSDAIEMELISLLVDWGWEKFSKKANHSTGS
jgi:hypothetical protein